MLLGAVLVLFLLGGPGPASAHAALTATDPEDGTVLQRAPSGITLTFTESVGLRDDSFRVLDPGGHRVRTGQAGRADGRSDTARLTLREKLGEGTYTVAWRVVSADSHPVSGAFTFSVGRPSATAAPVDAGPAEGPLTGALHQTARYLAYLAAALLIGTASFVALCRPPDPAPLRRLLVAGWWTLLASTVALLVLRAPYEAGSGPAAALDAEAFGGTLTSRPGALLLVRLVLLLVAGALVLRMARLPRRPARTPLAVASGTALAVGLALTWAAAEHASAGIQVPAAMVSSVLHLLATAVWLGGLTALLTLLRRPAPAAVAARFSRLAPVCVTVLAVTGVYQSWRGLGSWSALTGTTYGRLLLAKLSAVALLLAAAALSRRWTARLATADAETAVRPRERLPEPVGGPPPPPPDPSPPDPSPERAAGDAHRRRLRRCVLVEAGVAAVVLAVTTVLAGTLPGRAAAEAGRGTPAGGVLPASVTTIPFDTGTPGGRGTVQITLDPGRTGDNAVQAVVFGPDGGLATVPELRLSFTLPDRDIGPVQAELVDRGGYWSANTVTLPLPGTWTMKATVRVSEVDQVSETRKTRIAP
ncbi:copper resistance protein CopC [Streptomyces sp. TRM S81-3]|uniref:Protein YobA n=1 Tax=Streptomyces griseicoloratus TaxID=2752516 RepID=A0A926QTN1_9ACTN|nr:copper resistance CopC family protein [Streptomyces griseicoloratus]MBD0423443.1 copper resistance protein CopC [Streptomyces griseicoloratus]